MDKAGGGVMRIAVFHNLPSGGAKRTLSEAVKRLAARHLVDVYTLSTSDHEFADLRPWAAGHHVVPAWQPTLLNSPFGRLNQAVRCAELLKLGRLSKQVARTIDGKGYDVALVHPCRVEQSPSLLRHLRHTPSVYYCQEAQRLSYEVMPPRPYDDDAQLRRRVLNRLDPLPSLYRKLVRQVDRRNLRCAGTVLVNSTFMARSVADIYGVEAQVSYHGVDVDQFKPTGVEKRRMVLSVGSLTPLKGFDFVIKAMAEYPAASRPTLVIASNFQNPPEVVYLTQLAGHLGVELVLAGNVSEAALVRLYNEARVVVYAPVREPFGLVPLESMACGTPVVAVAEGGVSETVIDGFTGRLVDRDAVRFAGAVRQLVDDPALARRYGENGRTHAERHWSWQRAVASLEEHLTRCARQRSCTQPSLPVLAH